MVEHNVLCGSAHYSSGWNRTRYSWSVGSVKNSGYLYEFFWR